MNTFRTYSTSHTGSIHINAVGLDIYIVCEILLLYIIGRRLAEYEVFVQYYNKLINPLRHYALKLCYGCCISHDWMMKYFEKYSHKAKDDSIIGLLLAEIAMQLHSGNTFSFYEMLKFMQNWKLHTTVHHLAKEIQEEIKGFHQNTSSSMSLCIFNYVQNNDSYCICNDIHLQSLDIGLGKYFNIISILLICNINYCNCFEMSIILITCEIYHSLLQYITICNNDTNSTTGDNYNM